MSSRDLEFDHYMIDMETLGLSVKSKILSIGLVHFDPFATSEEECYKDSIYLTPSIAHQTARTMDTDTLNWWMKQPEALRPCGNQDPQYVADKLKGFISATSANPILWAQGTDFDITKLESFCEMYSRSVGFPWRYNSKRDLRTLISLCPHIEWPENPQKHNALEDAKCQARMVWRCLNHINSRGMD